MKISLKKVLVVFFIIIFSLQINAFASFSETIEGAENFLRIGENQISPIREPDLKGASDYIYKTLLTIAIVVAGAVGIVLGIQFVIASVEDKAKVKEALVPYVVGCFVVFGSFTIWSAVVKIGNKTIGYNTREYKTVEEIDEITDSQEIKKLQIEYLNNHFATSDSMARTKLEEACLKMNFNINGTTDKFDSPHNVYKYITYGGSLKIVSNEYLLTNLYKLVKEVSDDNPYDDWTQRALKAIREERISRTFSPNEINKVVNNSDNIISNQSEELLYEYLNNHYPSNDIIASGTVSEEDKKIRKKLEEKFNGDKIITGEGNAKFDNIHNVYKYITYGGSLDNISASYLNELRTEASKYSDSWSQQVLTAINQHTMQERRN